MTTEIHLYQNGDTPIIETRHDGKSSGTISMRIYSSYGQAMRRAQEAQQEWYSLADGLPALIDHWPHADPLDAIEPDSNIEARQQADENYDSFMVNVFNPAKQRTIDFFKDAGSVADLPLFSGTAPRQQVKPFIETDTAPKQTKMEL